MGMDKAKKFLYMTFHIVFIISFLCVFFVIINHQKNNSNLFLSLLFTTFFIILILWLYWFIVKSSKCFKITKTTILAVFIIFLCIQLIVGLLLIVRPSWDFGYVFDEALSLTQNNSWEISNTSYFLRYPNNQFYLLTLTLLFKLLSVFNITNYIIAGVLTNILLVDLSLITLYFAMKKLWGKKIALFGLLVSFMCSAYITYLPIFYTDTFPLPFMNSILLLYIMILKETNFKKLVGYGVLLGLSVLIGFEYKATVAIVLIAAILHVVFVSNMKKVMIITLSCITFFTGLMAYNNFFKNSQMLDYSQYDKYNYPYTHWVMMGLRSPGGYNVKDYRFTKSFPTRKEKANANIEQIIIRINDMKASGMMKHLSKKINYTWGDGAFFAQKLLERKPLTSNFLREAVCEHGAYFPIYQLLANTLHFAILLLLIISGFSGIYKLKKKAELDFISFIRLSVYGLFIFLLIWEAKSKYLVNFIPFIYLLAIDAVIFLFDLKGEIQNDKISNRNSML